MKIWEDVGTILVGLEYPPRPPPMQIWADFGTLDLSWSGVPPPRPLMKIWADLGTLDLSWSGVTPSPDLCGSWCVETNHSIPQGYRLVYMVHNNMSNHSMYVETIKITLIPPKPPSYSVYYC